MKRAMLLIITLLIMIIPNVNAAETILGVNTNKTTINPGDTVTITINLGGQMGAATVNIAYNNTLFDYVNASGGTSNNTGNSVRIVYFDATGGSSPGSSMSATFRAKSAGTGAFIATGSGFANADASESYSPIHSGSVNVKIEEKVVLEQETPPTTNEQTSNSGNNSNNQSVASTNANLKSLRLNKEGMSPSFNRNTTNYSIVVDTSTDSLDVSAVAEDTKASINVTGNTGFTIGNNKITITVTAPDNKVKKTYTINVVKTDNPELSNANLENLAVENEFLLPNFTTENTDYNMEISSTIEKLNILAVPQKQGASVTIIGNEDLKTGENLITITVVAEDKITTKDYVIKVYKRTLEEDLALENESSDNLLEATNYTNKRSIFVNLVLGIIAIGAVGTGGYFTYIKFIRK